MPIRPATGDDATAIAEVHVRSWQRAYRGIVIDAYLDSLSVEQRAAEWAQRITRGGAPLFVAFDRDLLIGWICIGPCRDDDLKNRVPAVGEIWALYVAPPSWGRGIGNALWLHAREHLIGAGYGDVTLWVFSDNARGRQFYERCGFTLDAGSQQRFDLGGAPVDEVRYRIALVA